MTTQFCICIPCDTLVVVSDSSSRYSDWIADAGINLQPPVRTSRRKAVRYCSTSEDEVSAGKSSPPKRRRRKRRKKPRPKKQEGVCNFFTLFTFY